MKKIRVSALAERDLDEIWLYVAKKSQNIAIADGVVESIAKYFAMLAQTPEAGSRREYIDPGLRAFAADRYNIYYRDSGGHVLIARVIHGRRDQKAAYFDEDC